MRKSKKTPLYKKKNALLFENGVSGLCDAEIVSY